MPGRGPVRVAKGQLTLSFPNRWGGARKNAGRKPVPRPKTPHRARPVHCERHPVHVTLRSAFGFMRSQRVVRALRQALRRSAKRPEKANEFRVVEFSVQTDHVHLLVEAADKESLSRGMQGLASNMARRVNREVGRRGRFWADRFHARALQSPRAVRNALVYVLANVRKHSARELPVGIDRYSSAAFFDGWQLTARQQFALDRIAAEIRAADRDSAVSARGDPGTYGEASEAVLSARLVASGCVQHARTWLLRVGWRRRGLIAPWERPARPG